MTSLIPHAVAFGGAVLTADGSSYNVSNFYGVLVALIGMAGVLGSALIIQIFSSRRSAATPPVHKTPADVGLLHEKIGRLEGKLEDCQEEIRRENPRAPIH